jgi:GTP-binding protein
MRNPSNSTSIQPGSVRTGRYRGTQFFKSVNAFSELPPDTGWEVALAGRSNAGKSSALNVLTGQRGLARTSKTPGRTQLLNFFLVESDRYLVDLPGYGFAQVPDSLRRHWQQLLERYLCERSALRGLLLVMDIRHPLTNLDQRLLIASVKRRLSTHILLTKADKLSRGKGLLALNEVQTLLNTRFAGVSVQLFSALNGDGVTAAQHQLDQWLGY